MPMLCFTTTRQSLLPLKWAGYVYTIIHVHTNMCTCTMHHNTCMHCLYPSFKFFILSFFCNILFSTPLFLYYVLLLSIKIMMHSVKQVWPGQLFTLEMFVGKDTPMHICLLLLLLLSSLLFFLDILSNFSFLLFPHHFVLPSFSFIRGVKLAKTSSGVQLKKECAEILEGLKVGIQKVF